MPAAYSSVACEEVKDTYKEGWDAKGGVEASVTLKVSAANKTALIQDLLNNQLPPPQLSSLAFPPKAFKAIATPFSGNQPSDGQMIVWDDYQVEVQYSTDPEQTLVSESIEPGGEFTRLDHRWFRWTSGAPLTPEEAPGFLMPGLNIVRTYYQRATVPAEVLTGVGKVHNAAYVSLQLGMTFAAETMLYLPNPITRQITTLGTNGYTFTIKFGWKPNGWNKFYRPSTNTWENIYNIAGAIVKPYVPMDLTALVAP